MMLRPTLLVVPAEAGIHSPVIRPSAEGPADKKPAG